MTNNRNGFTLVEILMAVAICGILAGLVWPSWRARIGQGEMAQVQLKLMELHGLQHHYRLEHGVFASQAQLPSVLLPGYQWYLEDVTGTTFTLVATAQNGQAPAGCERLTLDQFASRSPANCWRY